MYIVVELTGYYEWESMDTTPPKEDIMALRAKPGQDGKWLKKVQKEKDTYTEINLPEASVKNYMEHSDRIGMPKTRERVVAMFIEERIMTHHAHQDNWVKISVHDDPKVEAYLNKYFDLVK